MSETAVGTLDGITEKASGWYEITVSLPGSSYPLRLATKRQELVELARAAGQNVMVWEFKSQESDKINPKNNKPYINRYFEGVAPTTQDGSDGETGTRFSGTANVSPKSASQEMTKEEWARKDSAIHKMACIKTAADALKHTLPSDPSADDLKKYVERVSILSTGWHRSVIAERDDPTGEGIPF